MAVRLPREFYGELQERANLRNWSVPELIYRCLFFGLQLEQFPREGRDVFIQATPGSKEVYRVVIDGRDTRTEEWRAE